MTQQSVFVYYERTYGTIKAVSPSQTNDADIIQSYVEAVFPREDVSHLLESGNWHEYTITVADDGTPSINKKNSAPAPRQHKYDLVKTNASENSDVVVLWGDEVLRFRTKDRVLDKYSLDKKLVLYITALEQPDVLLEEIVVSMSDIINEEEIGVKTEGWPLLDYDVWYTDIGVSIGWTIAVRGVKHD